MVGRWGVGVGAQAEGILFDSKTYINNFMKLKPRLLSVSSQVSHLSK